ncbi:hypothetical protein [Paenibacillus sp. HGH0039]|uniref:hypothetical protein n=1 Tax=Paenibacillus sp. HGH0039 TaxID=1078505 RepID=UPI00020D7325|nr:hypothetical protein [Paenibacillus sp. HGH0039]EGL13401.1 hypothetical protein HMPREF9413_4849 [Paenibacillus sp. HGF7]EPD81989.1 hypothetical protein HMPREF1207_03815 [Paenibacillus sp. HGH0039]
MTEEINKGKHEKSSNGLIGEALIVILITAFGYLAGYLYEVGYKDYYELPDMFVEVGLPTIIKSTWSLFRSIMITLLLVNFLSFLDSNRFEISTNQNSLFCYIVLFSIFYNLGSMIVIFAVVVLFAFSILVYVIIPIFKYKELKKISARIIHNEKVIGDNILKGITLKYGSKVTVIIFFVAIVTSNMFLVQEKGKNDAREETEYLVTNTTEPMIVIDSYKDYFILAPVDIKNKTFTPQYKLLKQSKDTPDLPTFEKKKIGPLKPKE